VIERGLRYSYERRLFLWALTALQLSFLLIVVTTGLARRWADICARLVGGCWFLTLILVGASIYLAEQLLALPVRLIRLEHSRAWQLTHLSTADWLLDYAKALAVTLFVGTIVLAGLYLLIRWSPRWWWLPAGIAGTLFGVGYAFLLPLLIDPLFNTFKPLEDQALRERFRVLAKRAGVKVDEVLVMDASRQGSHSNAYFTGFGGTRRIVVYDTLLKPYADAGARSATRLVGNLAWAHGIPAAATSPLVLQEPDEAADAIESILAHEIGHWQHDHIFQGIALAALGGLAGLFVLSWILRWAVSRAPFHLTSPADPAGLPLVLLLWFLGSWLALSVQNAISRHFEREADAAALHLARQPDAFIAAQKQLVRDNLGNVAPTPWNVWLFATHPPAVERIRMAQEWKIDNRNRHERLGL